MDIFDILGPVMVGPSSSHTAGAARIGAMARTLLGEEVADAKLHLYGSFAETGKGHGTDRALIAGLLGMKPDDLRIPNAFEEAKKAGLRYTIDEIDLRDAHPNTAVLELTGKGGRTLTVQASSLGGGRIMVNKLDGIEVNFTGESNTLVVRNQDEFGSVAAVTEHFEPAARERGEYERPPSQARRRRAHGHRDRPAHQAQAGGVHLRAARYSGRDILR